MFVILIATGNEWPIFGYPIHQKSLSVCLSVSPSVIRFDHPNSKNTFEQRLKFLCLSVLTFCHPDFKNTLEEQPKSFVTSKSQSTSGNNICVTFHFKGISFRNLRYAYFVPINFRGISFIKIWELKKRVLTFFL